jgi:hypothetical protein
MTSSDTTPARPAFEARHDSMLAACRWATRHNDGQPVMALSASDAGLRVAFASWPRRHEALRALRELGYAATADEQDLTALVTGWDSALLRQRFDRAQAELRALELTHHDLACAALDRLRGRLAASVSEGTAPAAAVNDIDTDQPDHRDAGARAAWAAAPITPAQINAADGTLRAQLVNIAATEQAIRNLNGVSPAAIEQAATAAYFNYRDKHGCDDRHAAHYAYADAVDGIDSSYEVAWNATTLAAQEQAAAPARRPRYSTLGPLPQRSAFS